MNYTIDQGAQNYIDGANGSRRQALSDAKAKLATYKRIFPNDTDGINWTAKVVKRLSKMVR